MTIPGLLTLSGNADRVEISLEERLEAKRAHCALCAHEDGIQPLWKRFLQEVRSLEIQQPLEQPGSDASGEQLTEIRTTSYPASS